MGVEVGARLVRLGWERMSCMSENEYGGKLEKPPDRGRGDKSKKQSGECRQYLDDEMIL